MFEAGAEHALKTFNGSGYLITRLHNAAGQLTVHTVRFVVHTLLAISAILAAYEWCSWCLNLYYRKALSTVIGEQKVCGYTACTLSSNGAFPSFRQLAEDLLVSVITVKRAYEELESAGIIYRRQGLGTFVAELGGDRSREGKLNAAREMFRSGAREAAQAGLTPAQTLKLVREVLKQPPE